jgi:hypothetical protein
VNITTDLENLKRKIADLEKDYGKLKDIISGSGKILLSQSRLTIDRSLSVSELIGQIAGKSDNTHVHAWVEITSLLGPLTISNLTAGMVVTNASGLLSTSLGTAGYVPAWTTEGLSGTSPIYSDGTNIGIGTTSPGYALDVKNATNNVYIRAITSAGGKYATYLLTNGSENFYLTIDDAGFLYIGTGTNPATNSKICVRSNGKMGLGTENPGATFAIAGTNPTQSFDTCQTVTLTGDADIIPTSSRMEVNGTYRGTLLNGSLNAGTLLFISKGSAGGYPTIVHDGHEYSIDENHGVCFIKSSEGYWSCQGYSAT